MDHRGISKVIKDTLESRKDVTFKRKFFYKHRISYIVYFRDVEIGAITPYEKEIEFRHTIPFLKDSYHDMFRKICKQVKMNLKKASQ